jgi:hypothetical protein
LSRKTLTLSLPEHSVNPDSGRFRVVVHGHFCRDGRTYRRSARSANFSQRFAAYSRIESRRGNASRRTIAAFDQTASSQRTCRCSGTTTGLTKSPPCTPHPPGTQCRCPAIQATAWSSDCCSCRISYFFTRNGNICCLTNPSGM